MVIAWSALLTVSSFFILVLLDEDLEDEIPLLPHALWRVAKPLYPNYMPVNKRTDQLPAAACEKKSK